MPTYLFKNKETDEQFEIFMKISELDPYKEQHPELEQMVNGAPIIGDPIRMGLQKPSKDFQNRLKEIRDSHKHSTIETY